MFVLKYVTGSGKYRTIGPYETYEEAEAALKMFRNITGHPYRIVKFR